MINFYARKPIREYLNTVTEPPYYLPTDLQNKAIESIMQVYEESTNKERQNFLCTDIESLMRVYMEERKSVNGREKNDTHRLSMLDIQQVIISVIGLAKQWGVYLPESEIQKYKDVDFGAYSFHKLVSIFYKTNSTHTKYESLPAATSPVPRRKAGRPKANDFSKVIADRYKEQTIIILEQLAQTAINIKDPEKVIKLFVICYRKGLITECPKYTQTLALVGIEDENNCPYNHQAFDRKKKMFFDEHDGYKSLLEIVSFDPEKEIDKDLQSLFSQLGIAEESQQPDTSPKPQPQP